MLRGAPTRGMAMEWHRSSVGSTRTPIQRSRLLAVTVGVVSLLGLTADVPAAGTQESGPNLTTSPESVTLDSVVDGARSASGPAAETDASLLSASRTWCRSW